MVQSPTTTKIEFTDEELGFLRRNLTPLTGIEGVSTANRPVLESILAKVQDAETRGLD